MRAAAVSAAALLLTFAVFTLQVSAGEDLYWEGEEDGSNEFLEVNEKKDSFIGNHLRRLKRQFFFDLFGSSSTSTTTESYDSATEDPQFVDDENTEDNDFDNDGSGMPERDKDPEPREKTLRVTFVVFQPYQTEYSNRDSEQFQSFSKSLADAVNILFDATPGTQRASLVRIQSRIADNFSCKVTLDIVTTGFEDTDRITELLRDHIRNRRVLGRLAVSDTDFSATVIDPGDSLTFDVCASDELQCDDGHCVAGTTRCNGYNDCNDGSDEVNCPEAWGGRDQDQEEVTTDTARNGDSDTTATLPPPVPTNWLPWSTPERGDQSGVTEQDLYDNIDEPTTTPKAEPFSCPSDTMQCDETRCVALIRRCDGVPDCYDGTDERGCESCDVNDFRCNNGKCIEQGKRCNRVIDCPDREDELSCVCREDEFRCLSDGMCIELRQRCDGVNNCLDRSDEINCGHHVCKDRGMFRCRDGTCISVLLRCDGFRDCARDGSDEIGCPCSSDKWQCDHGNCIKRIKRCDGRVDCPTDRSDERNCFADAGYFKCRGGKSIPDFLRCNRRYDCPTGDYSDEQNCPCGYGDFRCGNNFCIPASKHCDRTHDCQDGSDERDCTYGSICMASQHKCTSGQCVEADSVCNGTIECGDGSDETNCPCKRDEFECRDGSCISLSRRCDGQLDCSPKGEDEINCGDDDRPRVVCPSESFTCSVSSSKACAMQCDGRPECDDGADEQGCDDCYHVCGGRCIEVAQICNGESDCPDGSDELDCDKCQGLNDFRCQNGECLPVDQRCNGISECPDDSDELNCNFTMTPSPHGCTTNQFQCADGACINNLFYCDGNYDCIDQSDEDNCPWYVTRPSRSPAPAPCHDSEFTCYDGRCIPHLRRCDNIYDCYDFSDEQNCYHSAVTSYCSPGSFRCMSGQCVPVSTYCDGSLDCNDGTDEMDCPETTARPVITTTYPSYKPPYQPYIPPRQPPYQPPYQPTNPPPYELPGGPDNTPPPPTTQRPVYTTNYTPQRSYPQSIGSQRGECQLHQWRCENGPCIDRSQRCNGQVDCPYDSSDEFDCPPNRPYPDQTVLSLKTYPDEQTVRNGGDVVFQCRDEGPQRAAVRWVREGARPLKPGSIDRNGRLEMDRVTASDSGTYICQAVRYLGQPGSELRVVLSVEKAPATQRPAIVACEGYQATCSDGQCIAKSAVCDGKPDCRDGSDEDNCNLNGMCEPNQFQCRNSKCILKTWLCDSDNDCVDGSDEENCGTSNPRELCGPVEFKCDNGDQCVPKSFHCDGQSDCIDGSDEIGCAPVHVTKPPTPAHVRLDPGESLVLVCEAVGVPTPLISWRLNWGHVPAKCTSTSLDGVGTLTCHNMQPEDSGAYSCEAINNKATNFATPDSIVYVNKTDVCPNGFFNNEARSANECIRCFCFGESTQCRSADLFTYNMPTPLGEGGTRLVGIKLAPNGEAQVDNQPITDQYYYQPLRNGATVTKLESYGQNWNYESTAHPYLTLPETYNGNQLTSYGGHIKYRLAPHSSRYNTNDNMPTVVIKGKYESLVHHNRGDNSRESYIEIRLTPDNWQKAGPRGLVQATREDIMMALDNIDMILLRADLNNAGVNITDFTMESAHHMNRGLGAANMVEECTCPPGYEGLSCQKCTAGYVREKSGPWLGNCVREQKPCPPGSYGDPGSGYGCRPCPCPLTNRENQFARTCSIAPGGGVVCDCPPGYGGRNCEYCEQGFVGNPLMPGDSCRPEPRNNCNAVGTLRALPPDQCQCKDQVQGRFCDQCKEDSFYLSQDFRHGCALCFCSGVSQQCSSSNLRRKTTALRFNTPQIVDQVRVYSSAPLGAAGLVKYNAPVETELRPQLLRSELSVANLDTQRPTIYYWSLPASFAGDKVTSYGGYLRYTLLYVTGGQSSKNNAADVQLISENRLTFHYFGNFIPSGDGTLNASIQFLEKGWHRSDGKEISREHFLLALADVKTILIKATYTTNSELASLASASIDTAETHGDGPPALHVEQCVCPTGYVGTSCEDCAPGYTRSSNGLYLEHCERCDCNGHSNMCHPETGVCYDCKDNTAGEFCESCTPGYERDAYEVCVPSYNVVDTTPSPSSQCNCDARGESSPCDYAGRCNCKQNVEGSYCERCRPGTFGLDGNNPAGCLPCYCSGVTNECHEAGHYNRVPIAAPIFGDNYGGYSITDINAERVINDQFVPAPNESELIYIFPFPADVELFWSLPVFPGNRVLSYGGSLSLTQSFTSEYPDESTPGTDVVLVSDSVSLYWTNPTPIRSGETLSYQVPLQESGWRVLNEGTPALRNDFMAVLKNLRRVLVKATLSPNIKSTAIADVSMDTATEGFNDASLLAAKGVEVCMCPAGYSGTSCENCLPGYYQDDYGRCIQCSCNGHDCQLGSYGEVVCNCRPPYTGSDCSILGLIMELYPTLDDDDPDSLYRKVTLICKYKAPEALTIKFYFEGREVDPPKHYSESTLHKDGWHGEHTWHTVWDTRHRGEIFECHTLTVRGFTLGVLSTSLPEPGGDSIRNVTSPRPPPSETTVYVRITSPTIKIQEVGSSVNFTCQAQSRNTLSRPLVTWTKSGGELPQGRSQIDQRIGLLLITNLEPSDSGTYICQSSDGVSVGQAIATLKVPGIEMSLPTVEIHPAAVNEYYEGDRIELQCAASGNPRPTITWQRASARALPLSAEIFESTFIVQSAREEDSGEYRCIAANSAGTVDRSAVVTVRPRPSWPTRDRLTVTPTASTITEGQSTRLVCTGSTNVQAGTIDWIRQDGSQFVVNVRSDNGVLYIDNARPDNQGVYLCQTTSSNAPPVPVLVTVVPLGPLPPSEQSNITVTVDRLKVPTGGSGSVECNPTGYPLPLIKWRKHDGQFGAGVSQRENSLLISNMQEEDQGYYLCEGAVDNQPVANIYVYIELERREPPRVEIWPPGEQAVALGSQFELHCRVLGGIPEPDVMWDRNGGRTLSTYAQLQPQNVLRFEKIEVNDEGEYTCSASNVAGSASASAVLKVRSTPEIIITPTDFAEAAIGDPVTIECRGSGYPEPLVSISSNRDQRELVPQAPGIAVLRIASMSDRDEGDYVCTAASPAGTITKMFVIRVGRGDMGFVDNGGSGDNEINPVYPPYPNPNEPSALIAFEGKNASIECSAPSGTAVIWRRRDRELPSNAVQLGPSLIIFNASKSDAGEYECSIVDPYTHEVQHSVYTRLQIVSAPRITLQPKAQTVHPGQSPTVQCIVDGDDLIDVTWRPLDRPLSRRVEVRGSTLIFHEIEVEDAGQYECFARGRYANASAAAEVIVSVAESHENEQYAHAGAAVHLNCSVTRPNLRIRWTKDGLNVPRSVTQKRDGSLFVRLAQKSDSGHYVCHIQDVYGRETSNYINLHIEGVDCLESQFRCYDNSDCIDEELLCDENSDCPDNSDEENCLLREKRLSLTATDKFPTVDGAHEEPARLISIEQPRRPFSVGENVEVLCRVSARGIQVNWERYGSNQQRQYVETRTYGDGSMLYISGAEQSDAGVYRCTGQDSFGRSSYEDFDLEVQPATNPVYPIDGYTGQYTASVGDMVYLPCTHNLEQPVQIEWSREYTPLPAHVRTNEANLRLERVSESDAGTYVCRVRNARTEVEARAVLRVLGVVPMFEGDSWLSLPALKDAYAQFDMEISFKPRDNHGLILYNSQTDGRTGKYVALQLQDGVPQFVMDTGAGPILVNGDRPLQLNVWHTIRVSWTNYKVAMDVDNTGPFIAETHTGHLAILELYMPLYIGGVPNRNQLPSQLAGASGFIGCVSMLVLGRDEKNIMVDSIKKHNIKDCDSCAPNLCLNNGVCQEARNERGYMCLCASGLAGPNCERAGEACRPGLCGPGRCSDTHDGYKCACPVTYTGRNCDVKQSIEYPAFTGSAYLAIKTPQTLRFFRLSMKVKATAPVTDGIIMYCAQSARGFGGFMSLAVHQGKLEFRYNLGDGSPPVILTAHRPLPPGEWTAVNLSRVGPVISLTINQDQEHRLEQNLANPKKELRLETPLFVGGVEESIVLNNNTGVTGGFNGCIKDVVESEDHVDIVNSSILSANVQECSNDDRGDIPDIENVCSQCRNGGYCAASDTSCTCPPGFTGLICENRVTRSWRSPSDPCAAQPCRNAGTCRVDLTKTMNYSCDCLLPFAGTNCHIPVDLLQSVGFNGNGYIELPALLLHYDNMHSESVIIALAFHTSADGVLLYQRESLAPVGRGDFILLRVENGRLVFDWDFGSGPSSIIINDIYVADGERHQVVVNLMPDNIVTVAVDTDHSKAGAPTELSNLMNADSNIYIGGIPDRFNVQRYPGLTGCVQEVELMDARRSLNLGQHAVAGRNPQKCRELY